MSLTGSSATWIAVVAMWTALGTIVHAEPRPKKKPSTSATPAPAPDTSVHHVLVLPVDGNASSVLRAKLGESIKRLARTLDGSVTDGDTTFAEAALAVGCDPQTSACADQVLSTLAVDEMIYATATTTTPATASATQAAGTTRVVVHRIGKGVPSRDVMASLTSSDPPERVEPALQSLFPAAAITPVPPIVPAPTTIANHAAPNSSIATAATGESSPPPGLTTQTQTDAHDDKRDRNVGIVCATGGGLFLVIGLILWSSESSIQSDIDHHATITPADFAELTSLENEASTRATWGNVMVVSGLVAGGVGGYLLWRWHDSSVTVAPKPIDHGAAVSIGARW